ncbi:hypothetical protein RB597_008603 [Gaeumannomyces tritici]
MNSGDLMSDGPAMTDETHGTTGAAEAKPGSWNKRSQEEYDHARGRLVHQDFNPTDYPDPLLPRKDTKDPYAGRFPADAEARLKKILEAATLPV